MEKVQIEKILPVVSVSLTADEVRRCTYLKDDEWTFYSSRTKPKRDNLIPIFQILMPKIKVFYPNAKSGQFFKKCTDSYVAYPKCAETGENIVGKCQIEDINPNSELNFELTHKCLKCCKYWLILQSFPYCYYHYF